LEFFGKDRLVRKVRALDADKWRQYLVQCNLAQATISKRVKTARQIFKRALKWKMISENPFEEVKAGSQTNKSRMYFIPRKDADRVLGACPDAQWRLIFVLIDLAASGALLKLLPLNGPTWIGSDRDYASRRKKRSILRAMIADGFRCFRSCDAFDGGIRQG